jgi:mRNA interferase RelE/StbE
MARRVLDHIERLSEEPLPRGVTKLVGAERLYRVRVGDYRIVYELNSGERTVTIEYVRHRSTAYRDIRPN